MPTNNQLTAAIQKADRHTIQCRDYGHSWRPHWAEALPRKQGWLQELRCERCGTTRKRILDKYGDVITSSYRYTDGYLFPGLGRLTAEDRGQLRIASIMDTLER